MVIKFNLQKEEHVKKIVMLVMALALGIGSLFAVAMPAQGQALKQVNNGMQIVMTDVGAPTPNPPAAPENACTMGPVGTDKFGNLVGITAGHCYRPGTYWVWDAKDLGFGPVGTTAFNPSNSFPGPLDNSRDYQVVKFDKSKVFGSSNGPALRVSNVFNAIPPTGYFGGVNVCKDGNATGLRCGLLTGTTPVGRLCGNAIVGGGDSGGPVVIARNNGQNTEWVGINTRAGNPNCFPFEYLSAKAILDDLNPRNVVGSGFTVLNTP